MCLEVGLESKTIGLDQITKLLYDTSSSFCFYENVSGIQAFCVGPMRSGRTCLISCIGFILKCGSGIGLQSYFLTQFADMNVIWADNTSPDWNV